MILIKDVLVYAPAKIGKRDILICGDKIELIADKIDIDLATVEIIDGSDKIAMPGLIDRHVHVTGGGGEGGVTTRAPELKCSDLIKNGITTVLGLLGTDATTRTMRDLVAKVKAINELGLTAYAVTGSYQYPSETLLDNVRDDIVFLSEICGAKIALSDHRSSVLTTAELSRLASDVYVGGKLAGKTGVLVIHMGDGKQGFAPILDSINNSNLPMSVYQPTHINRNDSLLAEGVEFLKNGGYIDLTTGIAKHNRAGDVIKQLVEQKIATDRLTLSSDGNGSYSSYDKDGKLLEIGVASVAALHQELNYMISELDMPLEVALPFFTSNPALALGLADFKGKLEPDYDADIIITDQNLAIEQVIVKGQVVLRDGQVAINIPFE